MPVTKPFKRTCRQLAGGSYGSNGNGEYVRHPLFAEAPKHYLRAFTLVQKDLLEVFDYVEPADINEPCYSYRIHELHTRACIEVEANCTAILSENGYAKAGDWNMLDYMKLEATHHLSSYQVRLPTWHATHNTRTPFDTWKRGSGLPWYQAYNQAKHSRHQNFHRSNFGALLDSVCGLVALMSAQFITDDFGQEYLVTSKGRPGEGFEFAGGGYFLVKFPDDWPPDQRYDFNWAQVSAQPNPVQQLTF